MLVILRKRGTPQRLELAGGVISLVPNVSCRMSKAEYDDFVEKYPQIHARCAIVPYEEPQHKAVLEIPKKKRGPSKNAPETDSSDSV